MENPNDIDIPDLYMKYIMTVNAQTMAIFQILVEKGICTESELMQQVEASKKLINEDVQRNRLINREATK